MPSECLECLIGATRVDVPLADVERLLEYQAAPPPPLAQPWIGGIGLEPQGQELFLSVSLPGRAGGPLRGAQGLLFRGGEGRPRWALEVDRVVGRRAIEEGPEEEPVAGWACPPQWLRRGRGAGDHPARWLDVAAAERAILGGGWEGMRG